MQKRGESTEQAILEAAEELFIEQGFDRTTTMQIARRAGCNQALVHYYYRTKGNLFSYIVEEKVRYVISNLLNVNSSEQSFAAKVEKMVNVHFDFLRDNPRLIPFLLVDALSDPGRIESILRQVKNQQYILFTQIDEALRVEVEKGTIRPVTTGNLLLTILSLDITPFILRPIVQRALQLTDEEVNRLLDERKREVVEIVMRLLTP